MLINNSKRRDREPPSFANINFIGRCCYDCFYCLGKEIRFKGEIPEYPPHFKKWPRFDEFLERCGRSGIEKLYLTGANTDPLLSPYEELCDLVVYLKKRGFVVGVRTNGMTLENDPATAHLVGELLDGEIGITINSLEPLVVRMITGTKELPNWFTVLDLLSDNMDRVRFSFVVNRCNVHDFHSLVWFLSDYGINYLQVRRVATEWRTDLLAPDMVAYEKLYTEVRQAFRLVDTLWQDADVFDVHGLKTVFWRTTKTTVNSLNYFTDGTISDDYFIVEGYHRENSEPLRRKSD